MWFYQLVGAFSIWAIFQQRQILFLRLGVKAVLHFTRDRYPCFEESSFLGELHQMMRSGSKASLVSAILVMRLHDCYLFFLLLCSSELQWYLLVCEKSPTILLASSPALLISMTTALFFWSLHIFMMLFMFFSFNRVLLAVQSQNSSMVDRLRGMLHFFSRSQSYWEGRKELIVENLLVYSSQLEIVYRIQFVFIIDLRSRTRLTKKGYCFYLLSLIRNILNNIYALPPSTIPSHYLSLLGYNQMDTINKFQISPIERKYFEETRCLDMCVKDFKESLISGPEKACLTQCFEKLNKVEGFFLGKLKETMEYLVINDPALKKNFMQAKRI